MSGRRPPKPADAAPRAPAKTFRVRDDTIVAIATAPGCGAIAIVRLSGSQAEQVCRRVVDPANGWPVRAREATRCRIHEADSATELLDDGLITVFPAPNSYTGETVIEIGTHGGVYVPLAVQAALVRAGARPAEPGEFTERAVLAGKLDLLRAEAIADLIDSRSRASHRMALQQLSGALSNRLALLRASIIEVEALLAYDVDFPSEDDGPISRERVVAACDACIADVDALLATVPAAILGREGATVVLAGAPNAGKSSLLNALVGESRVIVSDVPGTTRDAIEVLLEHDPWPLRLIDTAGLRENADPLERLGIEVSARWLARANVIVACGETPAALAAAVTAIGAHSSAPVVRALTKCDLVSNSYEIDAAGSTVRVSATTGAGLAELLAEITRVIAADLNPVPADTPMVTRARHRAALEHARHELATFRAAWTANELPAPVAAVSVREAALALDELIGAVDVDDVLARVFSSFCVGK